MSIPAALNGVYGACCLREEDNSGYLLVIFGMISVIIVKDFNAICRSLSSDWWKKKKTLSVSFPVRFHHALLQRVHGAFADERYKGAEHPENITPLAEIGLSI